MNVSLTKHQKQYVEACVRSGQYQSASEVIREALRVHENMEFDRDWLEQEVEKGIHSIESGHGVVANKSYWKKHQSKLQRKIEQRRKQAA